LWSVINGIEPKLTLPTIAELDARTLALLATKMRSINEWEEKDVMFLTIINNFLDNNVISHVQLYSTKI
jgi:hypothetical protein